MRRKRSWYSLAVFAVLGGGASGCSWISDLDRFEVATDGGRDAGQVGGADAAADGASADAATPSLDCDNPRTLCVRLQGFDRYKNHLVVVNLLTENGQLRARALLDPAQDEPTQDVVLPLAVPAGEVPGELQDHPLLVEVWADTNDDRTYAADDDDGFRSQLAPKSHAVVDADGTESTLLSPTPIGGNFAMTLRGFHIHTGAMLEAMVIEHESGRAVGMIRLREIPAVSATGSFPIVVPGVIDAGGLDYDIEFYADVNGNRSYDGVGQDHSWVIPALTSEATGLALDRTHSAPTGSSDPSFKFAELGYQFAFEP